MRAASEAEERLTPQARKAEAGIRPTTPIIKKPMRFLLLSSRRAPGGSAMPAGPWKAIPLPIRRRSHRRKGSRMKPANKNVHALKVTGPIVWLATLSAAYCAAHMAFTRTSRLTSITERRDRFNADVSPLRDCGKQLGVSHSDSFTCHSEAKRGGRIPVFAKPGEYGDPTSSLASQNDSVQRLFAGC